jgi:galactokinase
MHVEAFAPGRVNLIGDHTDHTGGWVLPMAIDLGITVVGERIGHRVELQSDAEPGRVSLPLAVADLGAVKPPWGRFVAALIAELSPRQGLVAQLSSTLPVGAGLSSSAAFTVAIALAMGVEGDHGDIAELCQAAERRATGVPCGIMDQLVSLAGVAGSALLIDTGTRECRPIPVPDGAAIVVVHSGESRVLTDSAYAEVRDRCANGERVAAEHVDSENQRVVEAAEALNRGDLVELGRLMVASHRSLVRLGVSTSTLDRLVERLVAVPGVYGARLTGAGFGGCVVAVCEPGVLTEGWSVRPSGGAWVRAS